MAGRKVHTPVPGRGKSRRSDIPYEMACTILALRDARKRVGLTQGRLGLILGIRQPHVANVERLWSRPAPELLTLWKAALGVETSGAFDWRERHASYLRHKEKWWPSPTGKKWSAVEVHRAIKAIEDDTLTVLESLVAMRGDDSILAAFAQEVEAECAMRLEAVLGAAGWRPEEISTNPAMMVRHILARRAQSLPLEEISVEPEAEVAPPVWTPPTIPAPEPPKPEPRRLLRAVLVSNDPTDLIEREYLRKLPTYAGVEVVRVVVPNRRIEGDLSDVDLVLACIGRMGHNESDETKRWASRAGKRCVFIRQHASTWARALGSAA